MTIVDGQHVGSPSFRRSRSGPEQELVNWFLEQEALRPRKGEHVTIFREPRLPSGFPDLVAVIWNESVVQRWSPARRFLTSTDLRLMHHLSASGPADWAGLRTLFGSGVKASLDSLVAAEMVTQRGDAWRAKSLRSVFAARRIVAIEAKINSWTTAVEQAFLNTWFAPESYVLAPTLPSRYPLLDVASAHGIGVLWGPKKIHRELPPKSNCLPRSYVSWLLNDWAWRVSRSQLILDESRSRRHMA